MKIRDLIRFVVLVVGFFLHLSFQWYAWKIHLGEIPRPGDIGDELWQVLSFPLFTVLSRRMAQLHFYELLLFNSALWGAALAWVAGLLFRPRSRGTKLADVARARGLSGPAGSQARASDRTVKTEAPPPVSRAEENAEARRRLAPAGAKTFGRGRYEVLEEIGRGGFSIVYRARDRTRGIDVAVKAIDITTIAPEELSNFIEAFRHEAALAGRLDHPNIVPVFDHDADARPPFIVMSLIKGGTLRDRLGGEKRGQRMEWPEVAKMGVQVAEALDYARGQGVKAHRDIKPGNIFCADSGYKVGDFGIARRAKVADLKGAQTLLAGAGTPGYMAPEQILAPSTVDWRADLFALAVVLHEALTGSKLFRGVRIESEPGEDPGAARAIIEAAYTRSVPLRAIVADVPAAIAEAIEKALEFERIRRHASWQEFTSALRQG
jgi:hypothetical protein